MREDRARSAHLPFLAVSPFVHKGDLVIITADHGNDPSWHGTDHTREHIPILCFGPGIGSGSIGRRASFADIGATVLAHLGVRRSAKGEPWL